jgi:hypothetical protein
MEKRFNDERTKLERRLRNAHSHATAAKEGATKADQAKAKAETDLTEANKAVKALKTTIHEQEVK